ncbi:MAG: transcription termination factor NusA [Chloroflexota bacterium]
MKSDFLLAITQLSAEKNLPKEVVLNAIESALVSAYRKDSSSPNQELSVRINPSTGKVEVWAAKTVVEVLTDSQREMTMDEARRFNKNAQLGDTIMEEVTPSNAGRIAAQTAKQVILQRLREAEHSAIFEEYANREGDVITGVVQRVEPGQAYVELGKIEAILPASEQVRMERYRPGQKMKVLVLQVTHTPKGARVVLSRSHPDLLRRLFEMEIPEVFNGTVEIKAIAREAGFRSKVAVAARQDGIDPVGCCVGLRGIRIQNIVSELNGEKIDVILWDPDQASFIAHALSPTQIVSVQLNHEAEIATVVVPDRQLSLAIGKEGQNARLAAKMTGWRIDIKSASSAEAERLAAAAAAAPAEVAEEEAALPEAEAALVGEAAEPVSEIPAEIPDLLEPEPAAVEETAAAGTSAVEEEVEAVIFEPVPVVQEAGRLRFAEDIGELGRGKGVNKKKKKKAPVRETKRETKEEGVKMKKATRATRIEVPDEEDLFE